MNLHPLVLLAAYYPSVGTSDLFKHIICWPGRNKSLWKVIVDCCPSARLYFCLLSLVVAMKFISDLNLAKSNIPNSWGIFPKPTYFFTFWKKNTRFCLSERTWREAYSKVSNIRTYSNKRPYHLKTLKKISDHTLISDHPTIFP